MICTLLIVDDEPIVRYGIRHSIDWASHDITVVGEAENGAIALKKAQFLRPDILLCDIRMPIVNGLTLIQQLKDCLPESNIVILTGHADSEYLMQAIRNGVKDYLLKPATMESILEAVCRVAEAHRQKRLAEVRQSQKEDLLAENLLVLQSAFFSELLSSATPPEIIREKARQLNISLAGPCYQLLLLSDQQQPLKLMQVCHKAYEAFTPFVVQLPVQNVIAVLLNTVSTLPQAKLTAASADVIDYTESIIAVSGVFSSLMDLAIIYPQALSLVRRGLWFEHADCVPITCLNSLEEPGSELDRMERMVVRATTEGDPEVIAQCANEFFEYIVRCKPEFSQAEKHFNQLIRSISMLSGDPSEGADDITGCTVAQLRKHFFDACRISFLGSNRGQGQSGRALRYIEQHYREELSLESAASQLYLSPTYLSRLLKEKTNHGFQYWVNYFRIQKAKELLLEGHYKSYEIAELVGYNSYKIFSGHFARFTHRSATEYKQQSADNTDKNSQRENRL